MTVTDLDVMRAHPDLPALGVLLDPGVLREVTVELGCGPLRLERLRLKPGASVTAMLRPEEGSGPWVLARGFAPEPWATKRQKDLMAAARAGVPGWELAAPRLVLVQAAADRRLRELAALRPDTGGEVRVKGFQAPVTVRTLSHNPVRRWVGLAVAGETWHVLRLHRDRPADRLPWVPGRTWAPGDPLPPLLACADSLVPTAAGPVSEGDPADAMHAGLNAPLAEMDVRDALDAAVAGMRMIHGPWADRAAAVATASADRLGGVPRVPAHGDLTPDQVVLGPDGTTVLDWDRAGRWPVGWDAATWTAGLIVAGWHPGDGLCAVEGVPVAPAVLAAAAILRGPEPFRRRHAAWAERTEALLAHAERALA